MKEEMEKINNFIKNLHCILNSEDPRYSNEYGLWGQSARSKLYRIKDLDFGFYFTNGKIYWTEIDHEGNLWSHDPSDALEFLEEELSEEDFNQILFNLDLFN